MSEWACMCVCVCVSEEEEGGERESVCVCVCVCVKERKEEKKGRKKERKKNKKRGVVKIAPSPSVRPLIFSFSLLSLSHPIVLSSDGEKASDTKRCTRLDLPTPASLDEREERGEESDGCGRKEKK